MDEPENPEVIRLKKFHREQLFSAASGSSFLPDYFPALARVRSQAPMDAKATILLFLMVYIALFMFIHCRSTLIIEPLILLA